MEQFTDPFALLGRSDALMVAVKEIAAALPAQSRAAFAANFPGSAELFRDLGIDKAYADPYFEAFDEVASQVMASARRGGA